MSKQLSKDLLNHNNVPPGLGGVFGIKTDEEIDDNKFIEACIGIIEEFRQPLSEILEWELPKFFEVIKELNKILKAREKEYKKMKSKSGRRH